MKSKVARCLKVQKKVNKLKKQAAQDSALATEGSQNIESNYQMSMNEALSVDMLGLNFGDKNALSQKKTEKNIKPRVQ